jgi:hypothetical protein
VYAGCDYTVRLSDADPRNSRNGRPLFQRACVRQHEGHVLPLFMLEPHIDHARQRVSGESAKHHDRDGERHATGREQRSHRPTGHAPQNHAHRRGV